MEKYIIINYLNGKYGYKRFFELQQYNPIYNCYYVIKESLTLEFVKSYCIIHKIDFASTPIQEKH